jgi:hypothetical protein
MRFLELPTERLTDLVIGLLRLIGGLDRRVDRVLGDGLDNLSGNGAVDPDTADATSRLS